MASSTDGTPPASAPAGAHGRPGRRRKAKAHLVHAIPGRTRLRILGRRGDHAFFAELTERLSASRGVRSVRADPLTGSVLVHHDAHVPALLMEAAANGLGDLVELALTCPPVAKRLREEVTTIDQAIRRATGGELDLGTLAAVGLLVMAGFQLIRGRRPASAASLAWYGAELLARWRESHPSGEVAGEELTPAS
jgi:hypothetical protein